MNGQTEPSLAPIVAKHIAKALQRANRDYELNGKVILELGGGYGFVTAALEKKFAQSRVYGIDLVLPTTRFAPEWNRNSFICADMNHLPFATESIDLVVTTNVFDYANGFMGETIDMNRTIPEIYRVLIPGGVYIVYADEENIVTAEGNHPHLFAGFEKRPCAIPLWIKNRGHQQEQ